MQDFNQFSNQNQTNNQNAMPQNLIDLVTNLSKKFDGKSQDDLYKAILEEAEKGKRQGTLTNKDIDNFASYIMPFLDAPKQKMLLKIVKKLKQI